MKTVFILTEKTPEIIEHPDREGLQQTIEIKVTDIGGYSEFRVEMPRETAAELFYAGEKMLRRELLKLHRAEIRTRRAERAANADL